MRLAAEIIAWVFVGIFVIYAMCAPYRIGKTSTVEPSDTFVSLLVAAALAVVAFEVSR